jgi:hypothetical protein
MRRSSRMIDWYIPNFTPSCFSNSLPSSKVVLPQKLLKQHRCCECIWITIYPVWQDEEGCDSWLHPSSTGHTGQIVIHIHPQHIVWVASEVLRPADGGNELLKHDGVKFGMYQSIILLLRRICWLLYNETSPKLSLFYIRWCPGVSYRVCACHWVWLGATITLCTYKSR